MPGQINLKFNLNSNCMKVKRLSTNCEALDEMLGGGIEYGTLTNVYGPPGCGKTTFCIQSAVSSLKEEGQVIFIDTEGGFSQERLAQISETPEEDMDQILLMEPRDFEEQEETLEKLETICEKKEINLVVFDSLVTLYRIELNDNPRQLNSRLAKHLTELSSLSREHDVPVLVTNQIYSDIENGGVELVSRDVAKYQSKCLIELKKFEKGKRLAVLRKHRSQPEGEEVPLILTNNGFEKPEKSFGII